MPQYSWNIVESGVKHHKSNQAIIRSWILGNRSRAGIGNPILTIYSCVRKKPNSIEGVSYKTL